MVCIGGGHGLAQVLQAISGYAASITAVVTVADDGGSSGRLAPALDIPPPGDIRRCLLALTPEESHWRSLFEYRFEGADVEGHSLGNLIIAALADTQGGFEAALAECEWLLGTIGSVIPAAPRRLSLEAVIAGRVVKGQSAISHTPGEVTALRLLPEDVTAGARAVRAIIDADQIVIGPGSLYTSVIATLAVPGIADAVNRSRARLVAVANLITQDAETLGMDAVDHIEALDEARSHPPTGRSGGRGRLDRRPPGSGGGPGRPGHARHLRGRRPADRPGRSRCAVAAARPGQIGPGTRQAGKLTTTRPRQSTATRGHQ